VKQSSKAPDVKMPASRFITFKLQDVKKLICEINPFYTQKAEVLLKTELLGSNLVDVERHTSLISSWGVVTTCILDSMSDEEIQICLAHQFVSKPYRLPGKRDSKPFLHGKMFLTFKVPTLPSSICQI
jgi:hypothetical protein